MLFSLPDQFKAKVDPRTFEKRSRADHGAYKYSTSGRSEPDAHVLRTIRDFVAPGEPIVELGCNKGNNLVSLASDYKLYGVDLSETPMEILWQRAQESGVDNNIELKTWNFAKKGKLPWKGLRGKLKAFYSVHVLSHLSDNALIRSMQGISEYLAPGGVALVSILSPKQGRATGHEDDVYFGYSSHSAKTVRKAFVGMVPLPEYSRPFRIDEPVYWALPKDRLRWYAFRKPVLHRGKPVCLVTQPLLEGTQSAAGKVVRKLVTRH